MMQPTWQFLFQHPAHFVALGAGSGLAKKAPGTFGTLFGWASFYLLALLPPICFWSLLLLFAVLGLWCMHITGKHLGNCDHGAIVWDEIVPFWALLYLLPFDFFLHGVAFLLFRFFDITKPWPACFFDQKIKNSFGVLMDDVVANVYAGLVIWIYFYLF